MKIDDLNAVFIPVKQDPTLRQFPVELRKSEMYYQYPSEDESEQQEQAAAQAKKRKQAKEQQEQARKRKTKEKEQPPPAKKKRVTRQTRQEEVIDSEVQTFARGEIALFYGENATSVAKMHHVMAKLHHET